MIPRLLTPCPLAEGAEIPLSDGQAHYLRNVLRRAVGDPIKAFNGEYGEYEATIAALGKKGGAARLGPQLRAPAAEPDLRLYFAPIKRGPLEAILQKGVELGVASFHPVITERTNADRLRLDRLAAICVEAAEQCGRLSAPTIAAPVKFDAFLATRREQERLVFCDEAGDDPDAAWGGTAGRAAPMLDVLKGADPDGPWGLLIGPEGGFTAAERAALRAREGIAPATLGPRILRADTAAIAAIALWQAALGDLQET